MRWDQWTRPSLSVVEELAATGVPVGVKLGPGLPHEAVPAGAEAEWVSVDGDVVEAALWFNAAARPGVRRAARVIDTRGGQATTAELVSGADFGDSPGVEAVGATHAVRVRIRDDIGHLRTPP